MNIRIKSQWFRNGASKTPEQIASAMAFINWRIAQNMLKRMRLAGFDIDIGPQYFAFTREVLVFLAQVLDRMAYARMPEADRLLFVRALVRRTAEVLQENEDGYLGEPAPGQPTHFDSFVELFNELADHYAEFGFSAEGPDFGFVRYLGHRIEAHMPQKDQRWVIEQVMASEVPDAVQWLDRAMADVLSKEPRPARRARSVASGD